MARLLFAIFIVVPLIEIGLFIVIGQAIGLWPTLLGVLVTALIGSAIVRSQGSSVIADIRRSTAAGQLPARQLAEGMMIGIAGALLLTPGYFTDLCGLLLLTPPIRGAIYTAIKARITVVSAGGGPRGPGPFGPDKDRERDTGVIDLDENDWRRED